MGVTRMAENIRSTIESVRGRAQTRIASIRGGGGSAAGSSFLGQIQSGTLFGPMRAGPLITGVRTKGVMATAQDYVTKIRTTRGGSILSGRTRLFGEHLLGQKETGSENPAAGRINVSDSVTAGKKVSVPGIRIAQ